MTCPFCDEEVTSYYDLEKHLIEAGHVSLARCSNMVVVTCLCGARRDKEDFVHHLVFNELLEAKNLIYHAVVKESCHVVVKERP